MSSLVSAVRARHQEIVEPVSHAGRRVSEAEYWESYYHESDIKYEWNDGVLEEKPVSEYATILVYSWMMDLLKHFLRIHPIARLIGMEMGFRLALPNKTVIRKPDFAVVRNDNSVPLGMLDASFGGVFDLCVEALSDLKRAGIERDTVTKKGEYAAGGVREYYILHREEQRQAFYSLTPGRVYAPIVPVDGVVHSLVLPGFRFRTADLLHRPEMDVLRHDPVYADFVLPGWVQAEARAEVAERARESAEGQAAAETAARQAAELELARLRAELAAREGRS